MSSRTLPAPRHSPALPSLTLAIPLRPQVFETTVARALEAQKPAMVPGASGEAFYRTIPFQVGQGGAGWGGERGVVR